MATLIFLRGLCGYVWVNKLILSPLKVNPNNNVIPAVNRERPKQKLEVWKRRAVTQLQPDSPELRRHLVMFQSTTLQGQAGLSQELRGENGLKSKKIDSACSFLFCFVLFLFFVLFVFFLSRI